MTQKSIKDPAFWQAVYLMHLRTHAKSSIGDAHAGACLAADMADGAFWDRVEPIEKAEEPAQKSEIIEEMAGAMGVKTELHPKRRKRARRSA